MPSAQHPHRGSQGWYTPPLLLPLSLLFLHLLPGPGLAHMHIPPEYHITNLKQPPVITAQPMSYTAFSADDITLTCEASGNPPPTFRWLMDGKQFDPTEDPWLNTSKSSGNFSVVSGKVPIHQYNGKYRCYASNELGTAVSEEVQIITENTPSLPKELKVKKTVQEGESVILKCDPPPSTVPPIIHWMDKNLQHIVQSDRVTKGLDGSLYFSHVLSNDSRDDYTCHAYYISARNILPKEPITLIVTPSNSVVHSRKPKFLQPSNGHSTHRALRGQRLVLECIPQGLPTPSVVWERKDELLSQSRVSRLNFDRWLQFENISESDDGEYQCTAINSQGVAKHTFTITVEAAPYWTRKPESKLYAPGETLQLHCKAEGIPTPTITWSLNGNAISGVDPDTRRSVHAGTLTLKDVTVSDTAVYQCEATNTHGSILVNTYVYVIELPAQILTKDELLYRVTQGQTAFLNCKTFGSPTPKLLWESEHMDSVLSNPRVFLRANGTLEITNASQEDAGHYTCSVLNSNQSIRAVLEVLNRTVILTRPEHLRVQRGQTAILHCHASVDPQLGLPLVLWRKDVQKLSSTMDKYKFNGSSLIVTNVQSKDKGVYTCEVSTNLDMANANGSITVVDRPDPPTHLLLSEKQARKLTLSWTPGDDHNSPINEFVVESEELKHGKGQWMNITQVPGETKRVEVLLQPYCTYHFRVIAFNEFGASDRSLPSKLHEVAPAAPDKNPEDVRSESTDPDKLVITWKEMDKQSFNGPGFQYKVMWRPSAGQGPHWNHKLVDSPPHIVRGTGTFTPFEIKVQSVNQLGLGPAPNTTIGHSGEDLPLESPQEVQVEQTNNTAFLVKWVAVDRKKVQGKLLGYKIHLGWLGPRGSHVERERESRVLVAWGENKVEEVLPDLRLFSRYNLAIAAFNSKGEGPRSELRSFETPEGVPSPPASLEFESPSKTELVLHWSPPEHPNGALTGYVLQYQIVDSNQSLMQEIDDPNASHITLGPLDPHSRYRFYLSGRTDAGQGDAIVKEGATLLDGDPPSNFSMFVGENNVNLSWVSGERYRNVVFHIRYLKKNAGGQWEVSEGINSTQSFYQLQGLLPGSKYNLEFMFNNSAYMVKEIKTEGPGISEVEMGFATQGWFIGLISAIVLLLLVLLILCFIKRSKGGKYSVKDKEEGQVDSEARPMKDETFGEYRSLESENEEKRSISQPSLCVESKLGSDDSLAGYGDSVDIQFNEDGSFIGQYSGHRDGPGPGGPDSSGATSPVNPTVIPPIHPGIPNSVTGILDRGI